MTDPTPVVPAVEPSAPAPAPAPEPKPAEKKLLDDLKRTQAKAKELEARLAEALPYVEKFKGHDEAKAIEAQREAEARARQEAENRNRQEVQVKRQLAAARALIGVVPQGDRELGDFAMWKLETDPGISYDPETGLFTGLDEAVAALATSPRFAGAGAPVKKPAPGLPAPGPAVSVDSKFANVKTYPELLALGLAAVTEFHQKYPDQYTAMVAAHESGRQGYRPTPVLAR